MQIGNLPQSNFLQNTQIGYSKTSIDLKINNGKSDKEAYVLSIRQETLSIESTTYSRPENLKNKEDYQIKSGKENKDTVFSVAGERERIKKQIIEQTRELLSSYFKENPEAAKEVSQGKIPDYFNEENTARRILNLWIPHYDGADKKAAADEIKSYINQAYGEVGEMAGDFPEIVLKTKDLIMDLLDQWGSGEDLQNFLGGGGIPSLNEAAA